MITQFLVALAATSVAGWLGGDIPTAPPADGPAMIIEAVDGSRIAERGNPHAFVTRHDLPDHLIRAVLAVEDRRFYSHWGVDPRGIVRAAWQNLRAGKVVEGGSTITQQTARLLFLESERTLARKVQEIPIAFWLESRLSKDDILERYLNNVYFGAGAVGIAAAAKTYFDKESSDLTLAEAAVLAGLIHAPSRLNPLRHPGAARERANVVLDSMVDAGFIAENEAVEAKAAPLELRPAAPTPSTGGWFADWIYKEASKSVPANADQAHVRTTLQLHLQVLAEKVLAEKMPASGADTNPLQVAMVVTDYHGAVLAMVGGTSYEESPFNRATQAVRQPGSAFKLFVYLAALRGGWRPEDLIRDQPIEIDGWTPTNYGRGYRGRVNLTTAFAHSINTVAVRLAADVGVQEVIQAARDLGIDADLKPNASLALGTSEVTLLDLTGAFASVAAGRMRLEPYGISLTSHAGEAGGQETASTSSTSSLDHRAELVLLLEAAVHDGTGRRAALDGFAAGKTGTSQDYRDAWFVGFTGHLVAGVWVGRDDNSSMDGMTGGKLPAEIWRTFMSAATGLAPRSIPDLAIPDDLAPDVAPDPNAVPVAVDVRRIGESPAQIQRAVRSPPRDKGAFAQSQPSKPKANKASRGKGEGKGKGKGKGKRK